MVQILDDGNLSTRQMKISPHFDANTILLYTKANQDISKFLSMIKSKEQCEQLPEGGLLMMRVRRNLERLDMTMTYCCTL
jgi:hypothetical protein